MSRTVVFRGPFRLVVPVLAAVFLVTGAGTAAGVEGPVPQARPGAGAYTGALLGGDQISNGSILCSVGFNVTRDGQNYILTAGHCTAGMPRWRDIGPSVESNFPDTDFGLIRNDADPAAGAIDMYDNTVQPITRAGTAVVGERVCASGEATGVTCGKVIAVDQTVDYGEGNIVHGLIETDVHTDHGDSGGSLFDGDVGLGTVSGGDGNIDYFQPLAPELAAYGVQLVPSGW